jgi:hypothetical protein
MLITAYLRGLALTVERLAKLRPRVDPTKVPRWRPGVATSCKVTSVESGGLEMERRSVESVASRWFGFWVCGVV